MTRTHAPAPRPPLPARERALYMASHIFFWGTYSLIVKSAQVRQALHKRGARATKLPSAGPSARLGFLTPSREHRAQRADHTYPFNIIVVGLIVECAKMIITASYIAVRCGPYAHSAQCARSTADTRLLMLPSDTRRFIERRADATAPRGLRRMAVLVDKRHIAKWVRPRESRGVSPRVPTAACPARVLYAGGTYSRRSYTPSATRSCSSTSRCW
jgi:hypothetical protein